MILAWLMGLSLGSTVAPGPPDEATIAAARAEVEDFPEDYGALVRLARLELSSERPRAALRLWERAEALAGRNVEISMGRVLAQVAAGEYPAAVSESRELVGRAPELSEAWQAKGWADRHDPRLPGMGWWRAEKAYERAVSLSPELGSAWCGLGWVRWALGRRRSARMAFKRASELDEGACGAAGLEQVSARWSVWGRVGVVVPVWQGHPRWKIGQRVGAWVGAGLSDRLEIGIRASETWLRFVDPEEHSQQFDVWGHLEGRGSALGARAVVGHYQANSPGADDGITLGWVGWGRAWMTVRGELAWSKLPVGSGWTGDLTVSLPLMPWLSVRGIGGWTSFRAGGSDTAPSWEDGRVRGSGGGAVRVGSDRFVVDVEGRGGLRTRPVRLLDETAWNIADAVLASGSVSVLWRPSERVGVGGWYEVTHVRLPSTAREDAHVHAVGVDVTLRTRMSRGSER